MVKRDAFTYIKLILKAFLAGLINDLLHVANPTRADDEPLDLSDHASEAIILVVASGPSLTEANGLLIRGGLGLAHLRVHLAESVELRVAENVAALAPYIGVLVPQFEGVGQREGVILTVAETHLEVVATLGEVRLRGLLVVVKRLRGLWVALGEQVGVVLAASEASVAENIEE
jgi:hypothetical protein